VLGLQFDILAIMRFDADALVGVQAAETMKRGDLVGFEQRGYATVELLDDLVLAANHRAHIDLGVVGS
jgi:hypothetical protein